MNTNPEHIEYLEEKLSTARAVCERRMAGGESNAFAIEVIQVDAAAMEDPPALVIHAGYDAARAVVRRSDAEPIIVLSLESLLESVYRSALPAREDAA